MEFRVLVLHSFSVTLLVWERELFFACVGNTFFFLLVTRRVNRTGALDERGAHISLWNPSARFQTTSRELQLGCTEY